MEDKALIELMRDMLAYKKREARYLFIALIAVVVMNVLTVGAFLYLESQMETAEVVTTKTITTTDQEANGDDGNIVNGDQYNDEPQNRSNK